MEGLSTKASKKKALSRKQPQWVLWMTIGKGSTLVPRVTLCTANTSVEMTIVTTTPVDMIITYQVLWLLFSSPQWALKLNFIIINFFNKQIYIRTVYEDGN